MTQLVDNAGLSDRIAVDSAGASSEHAGQGPDERAVAEATARGIDLRSIRARKVRTEDWDQFDLILVADTPVERALQRLAPSVSPRAAVHRMTAFGPDARTVLDVPDPYYGGPDGFQQVYDILERACTGVLGTLQDRLDGATATR